MNAQRSKTQTHLDLCVEIYGHNSTKAPIILFVSSSKQKDLFILNHQEASPNIKTQIKATLENHFDHLSQNYKIKSLFCTQQYIKSISLDNFNNFMLLDPSKKEFIAQSQKGHQTKYDSLNSPGSTILEEISPSLLNTHHPKVIDYLKEKRRKKSLLLHICCGPDAGGVIKQLKNEFDLHCYWYDPNIQPKEEYDLRLKAFVKVAELEDVPYTIGSYDVDQFFEKIKGLEHTPEKGAKCTLCYDMRLESSAQLASKFDMDFFASTLAISPHKVQRKLHTIGSKLTNGKKLKYLSRNFMKDEGFKDSVTYSNENDIYRQDYCGCLFSLKDGGSRAQAKAKELGL